MADKTEDPTPRRLRRAREQGDIPVSPALTQALGFVVAIALLPALLASAKARLGELLPRMIQQPERTLDASWLSREVLVLCAPLLFGVALTALASALVQTDGIVAWKRIAPDTTRLNPASGLRSLFALTRATSVLRALVAAMVVGWLATRLLWDHAASIANTTGDPTAGIGVGGALARRLAWIAALVGLALSGIDVLSIRRSWFRRLRMSKHEVKREHRETEGDPELKAARQRAHHEMLASATLSAVRRASILVVNPTRLATALSYQEGQDDAPRVVARGEGELARRMREVAEQEGIPVVSDVPLCQALYELELGDEIPEALYEAVAEILRDAWENAR